ncbi:MAG TPA: hypothetical protein VF397_13140 [Pyrinomonadaceae bacterium]
MRPVRAVLTKVFRIRSMMALALIVWCAGAGCMLVSYARASMAESAGPSDSVDHMMAGMSSSMDAHACCKAKHRSASGIQTQPASTASTHVEPTLLTFPSAPTQSGAMNCCPLTSGSMVVASRSQSNDRATVSEATSSSSLLVISSDPPPVAVPLRLPNRAHSYLLDCAFLI